MVKRIIQDMKEMKRKLFIVKIILVLIAIKLNEIIDSLQEKICLRIPSLMLQKTIKSEFIVQCRIFYKNKSSACFQFL